MKDVQSLMAGVGRMRMSDQEVGWGVGKHAGPGRNVFAYFVAPEDFVIEYTAEVQKVGHDHRVREQLDRRHTASAMIVARVEGHGAAFHLVNTWMPRRRRLARAS